MIVGGDILGPGTPAGGSPPAAITVTDVRYAGIAEHCLWTFSAPVTVTVVLGASPQCQLEEQFGSGYVGATNMTQVSPTVIQMRHSGLQVDIFGGDRWRITAAPANINESAQITAPQNGTTSSIF